MRYSFARGDILSLDVVRDCEFALDREGGGWMDYSL